MYNGRLGVGLISFNRAEYFSKVLESLELAEDTNIDYHLFQDGYENKFSRERKSNRFKIQENISLFREADIPNKTEHIQDKNIGNGINQFQAVEYLSQNYKYFMILEDDAIISPDYFRILRILIDQYLSKENDIFSITLSCIRRCDELQIPLNLNKVMYDKQHWFGETWSSEKWQKVRKYFLQYYQFIQSCDYQRRPHKRIRDMFKANGLNIPQTSQDAGKDFMLHKAGMRRIAPVVNRGFYIGQKGMHFKPQTYQDYQFGIMKPYIFKEDKTITSFEIL